MNDPDDSPANNLEVTLEEAARNQNSNLQQLIEAVGVLITASRDLMLRLQAGAGSRESDSNSQPGGDDKNQA